jgi:hypothetical protein
MENDKDWGTQLIQDYGFRLYNPAIGKFLSVKTTRALMQAAAEEKASTGKKK